MDSGTQQRAAWLINHTGPHGANSLLNGVLAGYSVDISSSTLIIQNITMNDVRNGSNYRCVILQGTTTVRESDLTLLYVAGEYITLYLCMCSYSS